MSKELEKLAFEVQLPTALIAVAVGKALVKKGILSLDEIRQELGHPNDPPKTVIDEALITAWQAVNRW